jgi:anti-sigma factor RsiW
MTAQEVCHRVHTLLNVFVDGSLESAETVEVEEHLSACGECRERLVFTKAMKQSVKRSVETKVANDVRSRMLAAMAAAKTEPELATEVEPVLATVQEISSAPRRKKVVRWASWTMAAAAAAAFFIVPAVNKRTHSRSATLADILAEHSRPLPPESEDPQAVRRFERYVGVPVRPLALSNKSRLMGGRVLPVQRERAAMLQYEVDRGGQPQRVSMFIYDPTRIRVEDADLEARAVGTSEVRVGRANGYTVAVPQREGVGYLVASEMDADMSADLVMNASEMR